jgi:type I restriction enzyme S subunit
VKQHWQRSSLKNLCVVDWGNTNLTKSSYLEDGEFLAVSAAGCDGRIGHKEHEAGTPVLSAIGAQCGKMFLPNESFTAIKNTITLTPRKNLCTGKFLFHLLNHITLPQRGAGQPFISKGDIESFVVSYPEIQEQDRIVTLLDEAFADIATAKANAEKNLQNARELFEGHLQSIFSNPGRGWQARTLEELGTITSSKRIFKDEYVEVGIPFYRTKEIKELANGLEITTELFITEYRYNEIKSGFGVPKKGDILLTAIGTIGEIWVVDGKNDFYFKDGNVLWLKNFNSVNTQFLKYVLLSFVESLKKMSHGSAYSALPIQRLNAHQIFLPTLEEQAQIVNALDELLDFSRQLEAIYGQKLTALDDLKKSLLHQAFSGRL